MHRSPERLQRVILIPVRLFHELASRTLDPLRNPSRIGIPGILEIESDAFEIVGSVDHGVQFWFQTDPLRVQVENDVALRGIVWVTVEREMA